MTDPAQMTATELLGLYKSRGLSPVEATRAVLERIEGHDQRVNAFCLVDSDAALEAARASEERYMAGDALGKLDGVPASVKDVFLTRGWPTLRGSKAISPDGPWEDDAPLVSRLREHGSVLLGKTTTPELGWKGVTDNLLTGITRNPWDTSKTPGGSSGGSAAAVALGMGPLSVGTDGGGSVRIPAAFSGIFGLKPSYGRIPLWPPSPFGSLSHAGPMANTARDAALMLEAMSEPDARDATALPYEKVEYSKEIEGEGIEGLRIAFSPNLGYVDVNAEVAEAVEKAARTFEELGAHVEEKDPGFDDPVECFNAHWFTAAASFVGHFEDGKRELIDPGLEEIVAAGEKYSALEYLAAAEARADLGLRMSLFHETYDLLLTPAMPIPAFEAGRNVPENFPHRQWMSWTPFSYPFNLTQQPAASVPCGFMESGMPIGLQIVGGRYDDALVLRASHAYQTARPLDRRPPEE
ncbi:MAG: amidase [Actinomycetota bacterium]|jgi:aspartyl-tRNA(Asn)/glutamyl-tRNA(Gln) amidotransferase subunit A|nr:amidase [Rubrobacter sp.]MDQ3507941.1 amidase [Actinomycetota bacterium]